MSVGIVIQARLASSRLPCKAMLDMHGVPILGRVIQRCKFADLPIFLATTNLPEDLILAETGRRYKVDGVILGDRDDVRGRVYRAAVEFRLKTIVRVTADNPLTEAKFIKLVAAKVSSGESFYCRVSPKDCPIGTNVEAFSLDSIKESIKNASNLYDLEHVTPWIRENQMLVKSDETKSNFLNEFEDLSGYSLTVDTLRDYWNVWNATNMNDEDAFLDPSLLPRVMRKIKSDKLNIETKA